MAGVELWCPKDLPKGTMYNFMTQSEAEQVFPLVSVEGRPASSGVNPNPWWPFLSLILMSPFFHSQ